ncbi:MAG TPA: hypothetical protein VKT52_07635, partial [Ktedonobacterales bacterium]|nr:hypothetical protein [Ktedonobacterales bacterium]
FEDVEGFEGIDDREDAGDEDREHDETGQDEDGEADREAAIREIRVCAPSFATFIYRFWLENTVAFKLPSYGGSPLDDTPLTDVERRYLEHYEQQNTSGR